MGIDAKETGAILWKILESSMNTSIKFMRNHPILSGVSMFLLTLYIFLPSLLFLLIYSSPVLACAIVYVREKLGLRFSSSGGKSCGGEKNGVKCHLRQQRSVRRNARMKVEEWDSQTSEEEKDKVILTSLYNDLLGRTPHFEESPKAIETDLVQDNQKDFVSGMSSRDLSNLNDEKPKVCNCEINEEKYGELDGKEEMSNVNEYGISEIERNRRLESLIARRRARRLFKLALDQRNKLQAEETTSLRQNNNLQITVPKNKNNNRNYHPSDNAVTGLQMPGSAPSVLLQGRNPFDIPYDPQEERPNLTGDSFDEEFSLFNQKDMFFCRHESFCRFVLFSSEPSQCMNSPASASEISTSRKRLDLDNEYMDHQTEDKSVENVKNEEKEVRMNEETDSNKEEGDDSSCSDESESELNRLNKSELREAICHSMGNYPGFLVNQVRNSIPSPFPKAVVAPPRLDDNNMFYTRRCANSHSRTFSVASDMLVEVSEIGSPPTTVDWLDEWSNSGENYMYDTDIDIEIIRGEESRKRLSHQYESSSGIGSKEDNHGLETKPMAKSDLKCVVDENLRERQTKEDVRQVAEEIFEQRPSSSSDVLERTNSGKFDGLNFHTSVSLSSITEEPEIILDSIDVTGHSENMNCLTGEGNDQRSLDSSVKKLVADANQLGNNELLESKVMEENKLNLVENSDEKAETPEQETTQIVSSCHPHTKLVEDNENVENLESEIFMQVQESNSSTLENSTDQEISQEAQNSGLMKDFCVELTQECNNRTNVEEEPVVSANVQNPQPWTQQCDIKHEDVIVSQDISKAEPAAVAQDTTGSENNDDEDMKLNNDQVGEAMDNKLELNLESTHHNIGLVDQGSEERIEARHITQTETTKDDNRVLED